MNNITNELNITVSFPKEYQMKKFIFMLAWMELCGNAGHCTDFIVMMDGDGNARPKFVFENEELQEYFNSIRQQLAMTEFKTYPNIKMDGGERFDTSFCID